MKLSTLYSSLKKVAVINIIRHATQLLMGILIARWLGPSEKGELFLFTTVSATASVLLSFGFTNSIIYHCKKNLLTFKQGLLYLTGVLIFQFIVLLCTIGLSGDYISDFLFKGSEYSDIFIMLLAIYCLVTLVNYFVNSYCLSFQYFSLYLLSFALSGVFVAVLNIIGLIYWDFELNNILLVLILVESFTSVYVMYFILTKTDCTFINKSEDYSVPKYAIKSYLGISGSTLATNGDSFILASLLSNDQIGIYSIAKTFYRLLIIFPQTINGILFGIFCDLTKEDARKLVNKLIWLFVLICSCVSLTSYFVLDNLIVIIYGISFQTSYESAMVLICAASLITISSSINPYLLAFNKPLATSTITLCSSSVSLLCSIYLIGKFGILGAAFAALLGAFLTSFMRFHFYKKEK